jgi:hypothetical protein
MSILAPGQGNAPKSLYTGKKKPEKRRILAKNV